MCDLDSANLIDLSLDDDICCSSTQVKTEITMQPSEDMQGSLSASVTCNKRDSLENNPFDCIQKLAHRQDDPFDIVEKEACLKAQHTFNPPNEVKLGNLLSLSDDNLFDGEKISNVSTQEETENGNTPELDFESPPVPINEKLTSDSVSGPDTDSKSNSSAEATTSAMLKKSVEYRKRLLKLSISNSALNSPVVRKNSIEFEDSFRTPVSSMFSKAAEFGENLLASESPLKLVEDDILTEEPKHFLDSEKTFEADLEMLKIPILNKLPSPTLEPISLESAKSSPGIVDCAQSKVESDLTNLEIIKAKLKAKREETSSNYHNEISSLIQNLKFLISNGDMVDYGKKQHASQLLESLSSALNPAGADNNLKHTKLTVSPQPIKRQGTFNIDLQESENSNSVNQPLVQEMPNCMISSSATYDGEMTDEKCNLDLPEISSPSLQMSPNNKHNDQYNLQSDINDVLEQLSKLFINNSPSDNHQNNQNPTFIVVMNSNQLNHNNCQENIVDVKHRSALVGSNLDNSINNRSPDMTKLNHVGRRRSQSLSLHDKVKIVQLPLQTPTSSVIHEQQSIQLVEPTPVTTTPPSVEKVPDEFKTPARMIRRNSYSSGTPCTAQVGVRRCGFSYDDKNPSQVRRSQTLETHHEGQQQAIVRPMSIPSNNLTTFKPDLKKKSKHNKESVIKSSGPLKATIPVKKVAPMLNTSPPSAHNRSLQSQLKVNRMPTTPMSSKVVSTLGVDVGYPSACSTPAVFTSPMKRMGGPINKPRYSYISVTPNSKSTSNFAVSSSLKRRTITEFKAKQPLKPRVSTVGLAVTAATTTSSRTTTGNLRLSTSAGARISKTPSKATSASNTATVKSSGRLSSRISISGSGLSNRNKEN